MIITEKTIYMNNLTNQLTFFKISFSFILNVGRNLTKQAVEVIFRFNSVLIKTRDKYLH